MLLSCNTLNSLVNKLLRLQLLLSCFVRENDASFEDRAVIFMMFVTRKHDSCWFHVLFRSLLLFQFFDFYLFSSSIRICVKWWGLFYDIVVGEIGGIVPLLECFQSLRISFLMFFLSYCNTNLCNSCCNIMKTAFFDHKFYLEATAFQEGYMICYFYWCNMISYHIIQ